VTSPLIYSISTVDEKTEEGITSPSYATLSAVVKSDGEEVPTCVYNEFVANRLAQLIGIPVASGVLANSSDSKKQVGFASLVGFLGGERLPKFRASSAQKAIDMYPSLCAAVLVFDEFIGNWDRTENLKISTASHRSFFYAFDHSHSLMALEDSVDDSIESLANLRAVSSKHVFAKNLQQEDVRYWIDKLCSFPDKAIEERCIAHGALSEVTQEQELKLARALIHRRKNLYTMLGIQE
jgi:hypothetical protein